MQDQALPAGNPGEKLPFGLKLQYAAGGMVEGVVNNALPTFLLFYATSVAGLSGALAGAALAVGTIVDAVLDPLIGSSSDNNRSRLGRRLPFMLVGGPLVALSLFLTFSLPSGWSDTLLFVWLTTLSIVLRTSLSLFGIPYQAVVAEISEDSAARSSVIAWRWFLGLLGGLGSVAIGFNLFFVGENGLSQRGAYPPYGATMALLVLLTAAVACLAVYKTRDRQHAAPAKTGHGGTRVFREVGEAFRNPTFRALAATGLLILAALAVHGGLAVHAGTYFWKLEPSQLQILPLFPLVGLLLGIPLALPLAKRFEKRTITLVGLTALFVVFFLPPTLRILGLLPLEGVALLALLAIDGLVVGALMSAAVIALNSMLAEATDEHEHLFGARREGLFFAAWLFAGKAAAGIGTLVAGLILQFVDFPTGQSKAVASQLDPNSVFMFGLFYGLVPGVLALAGVLSLFYYRLTAARHAAIMVDLHARRGERLHAAPSTL